MEIVSLNFGQCGLQLANVYWTRVADELRAGRETRAYASLYSHLDGAGRGGAPEPRCILVDSEMGPATQIAQEGARNLISSDNIVAGTDAAGSNWATAFRDFGAKYSDTIEELLSAMLEDCDRLEYFSLTFGLAGGTGSGLGTYAAQLLADLHPKVPRVANVVANTNVSAVAPYNSLLALDRLEELATLVLPFSNDHIFESMRAKGLPRGAQGERPRTYFEPINALVSQFLTRMHAATVDARFPAHRLGALEVALRPFPALNYTSPFKAPVRPGAEQDTANLDNVYNDLFRPGTRIAPIPLEAASAPLTAAVFTDGGVQHLRYAKGLKLRAKMYGWNRDGVKLSLGHPFAPTPSPGPGGSPMSPPGPLDDGSVIALANHAGIAHYLDGVCLNVGTLLAKRAFLHHFESLVGEQEMRDTMLKVQGTSELYKQHDARLSGLFEEVLEQKKRERSRNLVLVDSLRASWPFSSTASALI